MFLNGNAIARAMTIDQIVRKLNGREHVKIRIGMRPSGAPHIGTIHVINNCFLLGKALIENGQRASIDLTLADMLPVKNGDYYGPLLRFDKFEYGEKKTKADFYEERIVQYVKEASRFTRKHFGIEVPFRVTSDSGLEQRSRYRRILKTLLEVINAREGRKTIFDWDFKYAICPRCQRGKPTEYEDGCLYAKCREHGEFVVNVLEDREPNISLYFVIASVMRNMYLKPDVHVIGNEQKANGFISIMEDLMKMMAYEGPLHHTTTFFPEISKSLNPGIVDGYMEMIGKYATGALVLTSECIDRKGWKMAKEDTALKMMEKFAAKLGYEPREQ